jgi:hypothetical protein
VRTNVAHLRVFEDLGWPIKKGTDRIKDQSVESTELGRQSSDTTRRTTHADLTGSFYNLQVEHHKDDDLLWFPRHECGIATPEKTSFAERYFDVDADRSASAPLSAGLAFPLK